MPPIVLTLLQGLFLLLLYVFVARAVRAVIRDVSAIPSTSRAAVPRAAARTAQRQTRRKTRTPPRELVVHIPDGRPRVLALGADAITFGRADASTVALPDPYVSDHHAHVYRDGGAWLVADLGSTNGTFLNQVKVTTPTPIAAGDQLGIGKTVVEVRK